MTTFSFMRRAPSDEWGKTDEQEDLDVLGFQEVKESAEKDEDEDNDEEKTPEKSSENEIEEEEVDGLTELERLAARTREQEDAIEIEEEEEI